MKFSTAAVLAAAAGASARYGANVTEVTVVVDSYTTYCPSPTHITHGTMTYTVTKPTTLTITDCPYTIKKPIMTTSSVICHSCSSGFTNGTATGTGIPTGMPPTATFVPPGASETTPVGSVAPSGTTGAPSTVPTAGAARTTVLSGAGLVGVVGLAAFLL